MHTALHALAPSLLAILLPLVAASCRAADATQPASQPSTLHATARIAADAAGCSMEITLTNPTDHPLTLGRYSTFSLIRIDADPPVMVARSPEHTLAPHFRLLIAPGESKTTTIRLTSAPLPDGKYQAHVTFPPDSLPNPVEVVFTLPTVPPAPANP